MPTTASSFCWFRGHYPQLFLPRHIMGKQESRKPHLSAFVPGCCLTSLGAKVCLCSSAFLAKGQPVLQPHPTFPVLSCSKPATLCCLGYCPEMPVQLCKRDGLFIKASFNFTYHCIFIPSFLEDACCPLPLPSQPPYWVCEASCKTMCAWSKAI